MLDMIYNIDIKFIVFPFILYCGIYILIKLFMTEKRHFTENDKMYFTIGGAIICLFIGEYFNETLFKLFGVSFWLNYVLLVLPALKSLYNWCIDGWQKLYCILMRGKKK